MNETVSLPQLPPWAQEIQDKADAEDRAEADDLTSEEAASPAPDNVSPILNKLSLSDAAQTRLSADDYVALLEARPKDAFNKWKLLYNARARCGFNDELEECTEAIYELFGDAKDDSTKAAIVKEFYDAGLGNFYREVLSETDFFDENPFFIYHFLGIFDGLVFLTLAAAGGRSAGKTLVHEMKKLASPLWKTCWAHHEFFLDSRPFEDFSPVPARDFRIQLRHTLLGYHPQMRSDQEKLLDGYQDLRRMTLLTWFYGHEDSWGDENAEKDTEYLFTCMHTSFQVRDRRSQDELAEALLSFVHEDISLVYGAEAYLERLCCTFENPNFEDELLYTFIMSSGRILMHPDFLPYYASSGILDALTEALERQATTGNPSAELQWKILKDILPFWVSDRTPLSDGAGYLIKNCDFIELLARSVLTSARATSDDGSTCADVLRIYRNIAGEVNARSAKNPLRKILRLSLRYEWYRTLKVLRAFPTSGERAKRKQAKLLSSWKVLGEEIGLEEEAERSEYERDMKRAAQFCSWKDCQYHTEKSNSPMKTCVGCGEARYCGRPCQQRDWREGKHKVRCKRIKDVSNP